MRIYVSSRYENIKSRDWYSIRIPFVHFYNFLIITRSPLTDRGDNVGGVPLGPLTKHEKK